MHRRAFLRLTGLSAAALVAAPRVYARPRVAVRDAPALGAERPTDLLVAPGLQARILARTGDPIGPGIRFGSDADYTAVVPLPGGNLLVVVNHEFPPVPEARFEKLLNRTVTADDVLDSMGVSVVEVRPSSLGGWERVADSTRAWRITGRSPDTLPTGPAATLLGPRVPGTFQNCGGGTTPWGTVLTCEENVRYNVDEGIGNRTGAIGAGPPSTPGFPAAPLRGEWYGWVVELDPLDKTWSPRRHTALARFRHESVAIRATHGAPLEAYMGDDRAGGGVWRYTSNAAWKRGMKRDRASELLTDGSLAILRLESATAARWIPVSRATPVDPAARSHLVRLATAWKIPPEYITALATAATLGDIYPTEGALLVDAWLAGLVSGGSPLGRPEGCILLDDVLHVALTRDVGLPAGDPWLPPVDHPDGCVLGVEDNGATAVISTPVVAGATFGSPDNLGALDDALLIATDAESPKEGWANNSLLRVLPGGTPERILVCPTDAEVCGPSLAPDGTLFCSIQHPHPDWGESALICVWPA